jgi:hypothetical protein
MVGERVEITVARLEERLEDMEDHLSVIGKDVRDMRDALLRQRGYIAALTTAWAVVAAGGLAVWNHFIAIWTS